MCELWVNINHFGIYSSVIIYIRVDDARRIHVRIKLSSIQYFGRKYPDSGGQCKVKIQHTKHGNGRTLLKFQQPPTMKYFTKEIWLFYIWSIYIYMYCNVMNWILPKIATSREKMYFLGRLFVLAKNLFGSKTFKNGNDGIWCGLRVQKSHRISIYRYTIYIDLMPSHMSSTQAKDTNTFYWWFVFVFVCGVWLEIISSLYEHCHLACNELDTQALFMGIVHWAFKACLQVMLHCLQIPYTSMSQYGDNTDGVCARDARVYSLWAMNVNWFDMEKEMESVPTSATE